MALKTGSEVKGASKQTLKHHAVARAPFARQTSGGRSMVEVQSCSRMLRRVLPHDRQEGDRAGLEHEHPDLMECMELRTLGNLVAELGRVTAGWDAVPGERTDGPRGSQGQPGLESVCE